jgi:transposase
MNEPKPKRGRRQFDEEFRRNAVALVQSSGRPLSELATELGVSHWNLRDWTKGGEHKKVAAPATPVELQRELARLRRANQQLEARCEILKKALGILAEPSRSASPA